jgi:hypothetical protein
LTNSDKRTIEPWMIWGVFLVTSIFAWCAWLAYDRLMRLEINGGSWRAHWLAVGIYHLLGKWGVVAVTMTPAIAAWVSLIGWRRKWL